MRKKVSLKLTIYYYCLCYYFAVHVLGFALHCFLLWTSLCALCSLLFLSQHVVNRCANVSTLNLDECMCVWKYRQRCREETKRACELMILGRKMSMSFFAAHSIVVYTHKMRTIRILFILHIRGKEATIFFFALFFCFIWFRLFPNFLCACVCATYSHTAIFSYCLSVCVSFFHRIFSLHARVCVSVFSRSNLHIGLNLI